MKNQNEKIEILKNGTLVSYHRMGCRSEGKIVGRWFPFKEMSEKRALVAGYKKNLNYYLVESGMENEDGTPDPWILSKEEFIVINLNEREIMVFNAVISAHDDYGGDFAYVDEVYDELDHSQFTMNQYKGYLSQLVQKGYVNITDDKFCQINFLKKALEVDSHLDDRCDIL